MIQVMNKTNCSGCSACYNICPVNAIIMESDNEGFLYPHINQPVCIGCNKCDKVCPYVLKKEREKDLKECYAAYNLNSADRAVSSSGGIFVALAKEILNEGGIVFGAAYDETFLVYHTSAENEKELEKLIGSKYLQSRMEEIYIKIQDELKSNRKILFVGSSCQIGGLLGFLGCNYDKLICIDFICLGVPSPQIWTDYLDTFFSRKNISYINFKDKTLGWHTFSLRVDNDKKTFVKNGKHTYFFSGYFKHLYSRPSCSNCIFKNGNRLSDITISDCWGYKHIAPEMDDNKGLSSIVCHSDKGKKLFQAIQKQLNWKEADFNDVLKYNNNYYTSAPMGKERNNFWQDYGKVNKKKLFKKYCQIEKEKVIMSFIRKAKRKLREKIEKLRGK